MTAKRALTDDQKRLVDECIRRRFVAVWADMGAGKTAITLHVIASLLLIGCIDRAVIVAPRAVVDSTWKQEAALWDATKDLRVEILKGNPAKRKEQASTPADVYCIGRDGLAPKNAARGHFASQDLLTIAGEPATTLLVIDEASSVKNPSSSRFKALASIKWGRVIELTGTPTPQGVADLWSQIYLLDRGISLGRTITQFRLKYMIRRYNGYGWAELPSARADVLERVKHLVLRLEAPPPCDVNYHDIFIDLSQSELAHYKQFKRDMITSLDGEEITAVSAGALTSKLMLWASGGQYYVVGGERVALRPTTKKQDKLFELFTQLKPSFLVLYWFNCSIEDIKIAAHKAKLNFELFDSRDPSIVARWNAGKIDVLAAHPQSAGMGLNLQSGGFQEIWYTLPWSSELWLQTVARLARRGQQKAVEVYRLITRCTIDERISRVLGGKVDVQKLILAEVNGDET